MPRIIQIPVLTDNYQYLVVCEKTHQAVAIDAPDATALVTALQKEDAALTAIWNTHHHWDHVGANAELVQKFKVPVYCSRYDFEQGRVPGATHPLSEGDTVRVGDAAFRVLEIPGHTLGHIAYYDADTVFCGDTLFVGGCGRLFEGTPAQMAASLSKLKTLPPATRVYCMHEYTLKNLEFARQVEPQNAAVLSKLEESRQKRARGASTVPSTIAGELGYNPFLRTQSLELRQSLRHEGLVFQENEADVFRALRELKDRY